MNQSDSAQRVEEYLRVRIAGLAPGTKLPTERELAGVLGVGRTVLRPVLDTLSAEGHLERRQGAGTFVAGPQQGAAATPLSGELSGRGLRSESVVICVAESPLPAWAQRVGRGVLVRRVRRVGAEPVSLESSWLPRLRSVDLDREALEHGSLYAELARLGVIPHASTEELAAVLATDDTPRLLKIRAGAPLMRIRRHVTDEDGALVEVVQTLLRGDRFNLVTRVDERGGSGLAAMLTFNPATPTTGDPT